MYWIDYSLAPFAVVRLTFYFLDIGRSDFLEMTAAGAGSLGVRSVFFGLRREVC